MKVRLIFPVIVIVIPLLIQSVFACNGFQLYVDYFRNCGNTDVLELSDDFRPVLNDDCTISMDGCLLIKGTINTFHVTYDFIRNGVRHTGTKNVCNFLEAAHGEIQSIIEAIDAPRYCPINEGNICGDGKLISFRKHRITLPMMAGTTVGKMELETDVGDACFEFAATLNRHRFFGG